MPSILLIDDDPQIIHLLQLCLTKAGYQVTTAENGEKGLKQLQAHHFDLVITDIVMPEQDGFGILMELKAHPCRPKIIVMSGGSPALGQDFLLEMASKMSADRVMAKPVGIEELLTTVRELL